MTIKLSVPQQQELKPRIVVFGVGGAGGNAVNNMIEADLQGVEFVVANTDAQALHRSRAEQTIQMGATITQGLGAGARPAVGREAAEDSLNEIMEHLVGAHMVFITAGMGGGTGTGAAPIIASAARDAGILTVGVVTKPFEFEGKRRMAIAEEGVKALIDSVDSLIVIPNQNLFRITNEKTTMSDAFSMADEVLHSGVHSITSLMVNPGLINLDFADVRSVMTGMGRAMMGTGEASGETRAQDAAHAAIANPLLEDMAISSAKGVLINIIGGEDLGLHESSEAASLIQDEVGVDCHTIIGSTFDPDMTGSICVSVVATGIAEEGMEAIIPTGQQSIADPVAKPEEIIEEPAPIAAAEIAPEPIIEPEPIVEPEIAAAPEEIFETREESQAEPEKHERFPFTFFRSRRKPTASQPEIIKTEAKPLHAMPTRPEPVQKQQPEATPDLFIGKADEELEIPAFLRRQAN